MRPEQDEAQARHRLAELAARADKLDCAVFTGFLSPAEAQWAAQEAKRARVNVAFDGGWDEAERKMARFCPYETDEPFPLTALALTWPHQNAPAHRDILGSVMGLMIERRCVGDIALEDDRAILFAEDRMAEYLRQNLLSAGRAHLQVEPLGAPPALSPAKGAEVRDTVKSPRLDAVVAGGFCLSRAKAAELIAAGRVKLRHLPTERTDAQVSAGDVISVRGMGRLSVEEIGSLTKKGRYPLRMLRYGEKHPS